MSGFKSLFKLPGCVMHSQGCEGCALVCHSHNRNKRLLFHFLSHLEEGCEWLLKGMGLHHPSQQASTSLA